MKNTCISRELTMEMIVGSFIVMVFLGLAYFTIILTRETWFGPKLSFEVVFDDVVGLSEGDSVVVRGMPVGKVKRLVLQDDGVHVTASLDHPLSIKKDYRVTITPTSILGGRYLQLYEGADSGLELPSGTVLKGVKSYDLISDAADVFHSLRETLVSGGVLSNVQESVAEVRQMIGRVNQGKGTLGRLLSDDDTMYRDLSATVASLRKISERLEKGEGTLGKLLSSDDQLYKDLSATVASLKTISGRIERGEGTMGRLLSSDDQLYKDLSSAVASLKEIAGRIERGEGSIGKLVKDEGLYTEVQGLVKDARETIDDFRETAPVITFTSIFFGAF